MMILRLRLACRVGVLLLVILVGFFAKAEAADAAATPAANPPGAPAPQQAATIAATVVVGTPTPEPMAAACQKVTAGLSKGDLSALKELPKEKKVALERQGRLARVLACLAVADGKRGHCDALPARGKEDCLADVDFTLKLKALPKGSSPMPAAAIRLGQLCRSKEAKADCENGKRGGEGTSCYTKADCDKLQDAIASKSPDKCTGLPKSLATLCAAVAGEEAARCGKGEESGDCAKIVGVLPKLQQEGLGALDDDLSKAALSGKRESCALLLADLEKSCAAP